VTINLTDRLRILLVGRRCDSVESRGSHLHLFLNCGGITVGCLWRLSNSERILLASDDDEGEVEDRLPKMIVGDTIQTVTLSNAFHDLQLVFSSGVVFEAFASSEHFENWSVIGPSAEFIIAGPGLDLSWLGPQPAT
jgi:hypothetical protein